MCQAAQLKLPGSLSGQARRADGAATVASWGEQDRLVWRCGAGVPAALQPTSRCDVVNDVGWFSEDLGTAYRFTTIGRQTQIEVTVPHAYAPEADALVDLTESVKVIPEVKPCV